MMNSSTTNSKENELPQNLSSSSFSIVEGAAKKRKLSKGSTLLSGVQFDVLQYENERLKQVIEELENEKLNHIDADEFNKLKLQLCNMEETVTKLQTENSCLQQKYQTKKNNLKSEIDSKNSDIDNHVEKIKILEDEKQKYEQKIEELNEEILLMKTVKSEIQDSVENERENFQGIKDKLNAEINDLKEKNKLLEQNIQKLLDEQKTEVENLKSEKHANKKEIKNLKENIQSANGLKKNVEQEMENERKIAEAKINKMNSEINDFKNSNNSLMENSKELQNSIDSLKKQIQSLENNGIQNYSLNEVFNGSTPNFSILSCRSNVVLNVNKVEGILNGWNLYSDSSEKPYFFKNSDIIKTCFKLNITGELIADKVQTEEFSNIVQRINSCELTTLCITCKTITFADFCKLVSSKKVEICKLAYVRIDGTIYDKIHSVDEILNELPNVKEFKCFSELPHRENQAKTAKDLEKCQKLTNLQKFELADLSELFKIQDLNAFIKKQNRDVSYVFEFSQVKAK